MENAKIVESLRDAADLIESFINQPATGSDAGGTWISAEDKLPADHHAPRKEAG